MKTLLFLAMFFIGFVACGDWLRATPDKSELVEVSVYVQDSPEAKQQFTDFLKVHSALTRYDLIKFRSSVKPLVVAAEIKKTTEK